MLATRPGAEMVTRQGAVKARPTTASTRSGETSPANYYLRENFSERGARTLLVIPWTRRSRQLSLRNRGCPLFTCRRSASGQLAPKWRPCEPPFARYEHELLHAPRASTWFHVLLHVIPNSVISQRTSHRLVSPISDTSGTTEVHVTGMVLSRDALSSRRSRKATIQWDKCGEPR
jgi:hypothetical protein